MRPPLLLSIALLGFVAAPTIARAQCPAEPTLQNFTGGGQSVCPCFVTGEQAGVILNAPAAHYPIEILRVGIGWGSQIGGAPASLEESIHIYPAGLPNPGSPLFSLDGPQLVDGVINEFDLEPISGEVLINSGPFTVTLEFLNPNSGDIFAPSVVHDGNGCQGGKNVVFAVPGGWANACALGVSGDWVFYVIYRQVNCSTGIDDEHVLGTGVASLFGARPNPLVDRSDLEFYLPAEAQAALTVFDVSGRVVAKLADGRFPAGRNRVAWDGRDATGARAAGGIYFVELSSGSVRSSRKLWIAER